MGTISFACSDTISAGNVISQSVEPGETACDTSIDLVISTGACDAIVPDVLALTLEEAQSALSVYGFAVNVSEACSDTVPAGSIISQYPVGGTPVTQGSTVDLVVSTGPCPVTVPDVTNQTESAANVAITGAGLTVGTVTT